MGRSVRGCGSRGQGGAGGGGGGGGGGSNQNRIDGGELTVWKLTETRASAEGAVRLDGWSAAGY